MIMNPNKIKHVVIDGHSLNLESFVAVARYNATVELAGSALEAMQKSRALAEKIAGEGRVAYGITTGFGDFATVAVPEEMSSRLSTNLILSHCTATGEPYAEEVVRGMMLLRANALCVGISGVRPLLVEMLIDMLNKGVTPVIPQKGSLGASGDLAPLSHMGLVLLGRGEAFYQGQRLPGGEAMEKAGMNEEQVRYLFAGDLLAQGIATSYGLMELQIPLFGLYGACSTCGESLSLASMTVNAGYADCVMAVTSSHFASAEKEFRFPLEYAGQRPLSTTWTVTGSGAFLLAAGGSPWAEGASVCIAGITTGKVVDYGVKDSMHMGAAMAPAAADTVYQHLADFGRKVEDYDRIITGDLGSIGQTILKDLMRERGIELGDVHEDCGMLIYDPDTQDTHAGGSGCGCAASTLAAYILPKLQRGEWKRVLLVPTGALLSKVSFNEGQSIPGIAHGVVLEHC